MPSETIASIIASGSVPAAKIAVQDELVFDGSVLTFYSNSLSRENISMFPIYGAAYLAGVEIKPSETHIKINGNGMNFEIQVGSKEGLLENEPIELSTVPAIINGVLYAPLDFLINAMPEKLDWDIPSNSVSVKVGTSQNNQSPDSGFKASKSNLQKLSLSNNSLLGCLMLVNKWNPLNKSFIPSQLDQVTSSKYQSISSKLSDTQMKKDALIPLQNLFKDIKAAGIKGLVLSSGYRSYEAQSFYHSQEVALFTRQSGEKDAYEKASAVVAPPGTSEHQTGLAVDLTTRSILKTGKSLVADFANTPEGKWIKANSWKYGYVIRYLKEKTTFTGIIDEPWHIRYIGVPHAEIMTKNNLCLEEYLKYIKNEKFISFKDYSGKEFEIFYIKVPVPLDSLSLSGLNCQVSKYDNGFIITRALG